MSMMHALGNKTLSRIFKYITLTALVLFCLSLIALLFWMTYTSFKSTVEYFENSFALPQKLRFDNYTKAAEMLFTAQPNLSRAIKELESGLGITIFRRTPKGIFPTPQGEEFLGYARKILSQVDAMEAMYKSGVEKIPQFSLSAPGAGYIESAFGSFCKTRHPKIRAEVIIAESTPNRTINNDTDTG